MHFIRKYRSIIYIYILLIEMVHCGNHNSVTNHFITNITVCPINACDLAKIISEGTTTFDSHRFGEWHILDH